MQLFMTFHRDSQKKMFTCNKLVIMCTSQWIDELLPLTHEWLDELWVIAFINKQEPHELTSLVVEDIQLVWVRNTQQVLQNCQGLLYFSMLACWISCNFPQVSNVSHSDPSTLSSHFSYRNIQCFLFWFINFAFPLYFLR